MTVFYLDISQRLTLPSFIAQTILLQFLSSATSHLRWTRFKRDLYKWTTYFSGSYTYFHFQLYTCSDIKVKYVSFVLRLSRCELSILVYSESHFSGMYFCAKFVQPADQNMLNKIHSYYCSLP